MLIFIVISCSTKWECPSHSVQHIKKLESITYLYPHPSVVCSQNGAIETQFYASHSPITGSSITSWPLLAVDSLLTSTTPSLPSPLVKRSTKDTPLLSSFPSSVVVEGMPPILVKLIEKIREWEYVGLVCLLEDHNTYPVSFTLNGAGQWVPEQQKRK